ncbi:MAG: LysM domain-containing protein [Chloroflexota bacterium]|nr:LysM domain-containing protein [Chloroflexota bacterium]
MRERGYSFIASLFFSLIALLLIFAVFAHRTSFIAAQGAGNEDADDSPVMTPRATQVDDDEDDDDDDDDGDSSTTVKTYTYTIRPGDTLWRLAARLGVPYAVLRAQTDTPSLIHPGQKFTYTDADRIDSSIPPTDDDGTDSDGYNTPPPTTDFDGISTPPPTDNDGYDTPILEASGVTLQQQQQVDTDNDGYDTTGNYTDNDGTDSDGFDTTGNLTDNDGTDSDGYDTTGNLTDNDDTDDTDNDDTDNDS